MPTDALAVVTGGAGGIGAAIVRRLAGGGAEVWIADVDRGAAERLAEETGCQSRNVDVRSRDAVQAFFNELPRAPDILITAAGGARRCNALDVDEALFNDTIALNAGGFWRTAQEAARRARAANTPLSIVHIASSLHRGPAPELSHFAAAKAASITLVRCLAQEWASSGVRINAVVPGPIVTGATDTVWKQYPAIRDALERRLPLGRIGTPDDVAAAALWLASSDAEWVTGATLSVDGGLEVAPG